MNVSLLVNADDQEHADVVIDLLEKADHMECMVAFAKTSARGMLKTLQEKLRKGLTARIAVGLDFYLTEPKLLRELLVLSNRYQLDFFLSDSDCTFHPKIYAFEGKKWKNVLIGSANLTDGGLSSNYEASALINDADGSVTDSIKNHFNKLIDNEIIVKGEESRIDEYAREYDIHELLRKTQKSRADKIKRHHGNGGYVLLREMLRMMKEDATKDGFTANKKRRSADLRQANEALNDLVEDRKIVKNLLPHYEALIRHFHSSGLDRGKSTIAKRPQLFLNAVADITAKKGLSPRQAFDVLHAHFKEIPGAGINLITEILHAIDNTSFSIMNQNAVSGMERAGIVGYPIHPTKANVNGESYARYCQQANVVRKALGLANFTELDALFNYAYWR